MRWREVRVRRREDVSWGGGGGYSRGILFARPIPREGIKKSIDPFSL